MSTGWAFALPSKFREEGRSGLLGLKRGTIELTIDSPMEGHGRDACVSIQVDDADAYDREWSAKVALATLAPGV